ncbi:MAG: UDP-N-acetylmuramoyl-tripeptide--D-alanyl-D-alanine ligase [Patescibacteria group bacterium]|nr:UDP-N-acetylmuramoyl-tripeptide--D-alanyl-D-alanine ligase [Patescibacteria group bacterium]
MKKRLKKAYQLILKSFATRYLKRNKIDIIAITGSIGKTSTKEAIYQVLSSKFSVGKTRANQNEEVGVPTALLGLKVEKFPLGWIKNISLGFLKSVFQKTHFEKAILEMGADRFGDIKYLTSFIKPKIAVITRVASSHLEFFHSLENVAQEKGMLIEALDSNGWAILNYDDPNVREMEKRNKGKTFFFGLNKKADLYADGIKSDIHGIDFTVHYKKESKKIHLNIIGEHLIYSVLAGIACGLICEMSLEDCIWAAEGFQMEKGRLNMIKGINDSMIIDDSYNANPESMKAAIQTLNNLGDKKRKIAVLGDMLELGEKSQEFHREIGKMLVGKVDLVFAVGEESKFIFQEAEKKMEGKVFWFPDFQSAISSVKENIKSGDIILVKGSHGMHMEKIVEVIKK